MDNINPEFLGNVIDVFDDFLEEHNIRIQESDKEMESDGCDPDDSVRLYGTIYDELLQELSKLIIAWTVPGTHHIDPYINNKGEEIH